MFSNFHVKELPRAALLYLALVAPLASCGAAPDFIDDAPSVHISIAGAASEAQLITELRSLGYSNIRVTDLRHNGMDRRPELMQAFSSADEEEAQVTPLHFGWNGTAVKDGRTVDVYVDRARAR